MIVANVPAENAASPDECSGIFLFPVPVFLFCFLFFFVLAPRAGAENLLCAKDLDGDGEINSNQELVSCINGVCPHDTVECEPTFATPLCPGDGVYNPERNTCRTEPLVTECPDGYLYDPAVDRCTREVICLDGGTFNPAADVCEKIVRNECPAGYVFDPVSDLCIMTADCGPAGLNTLTDRCEMPANISCPVGYTLNNAAGSCEAEPSCAQGVYSPGDDLCVTSSVRECPTGYSYNAVRDRCESPAGACPQGYSRDTDQNRCVAPGTADCPAGYTEQGGVCRKTPDCPPAATAYDTTNRLCQTPVTYECPADGTTYTDQSTCIASCLSTGTCEEITRTTREQCWTSVWGPAPCFRVTPLVDPDAPQCPGDNIPSGSTNIGACFTPYFHLLRDVTRLYWEYDAPLPSLFSCPITGIEYGNSADCESLCTENLTCIPRDCPAGFRKQGDFCVADPVCPGGGSLNNATGLCETALSHDCPGNGSYNPATGQCEAGDTFCPEGSSFDAWNTLCHVPADAGCPAGLVHDAAGGRCTGAASCPSGGALNTNNDLCEAEATDDCGEWQLDTGTRVCHAPVDCGEGVYDPVEDRCRLSAVKECGTYTYNTAKARCEQPASCPEPGGFSGDLDGCETGASHTCPDRYTWTELPVASCETEAECPAGTSFDPEQKGCMEGYNTCPAGDFPCADIDGSGVNVCSPDECVDFDLTPPEPAPADTTGFQDDGTVDQATGECSGVFKIFNGKPRECLRPGWETLWFNCCDTNRDSWWFLEESCPRQSLEAAQAVAAGRAHYIGRYCRIDIWLIGCIQSADMYCTFNSKMARIIHEQGRSQLRKFGGGGGWGSPQGPNCEGFTPEEFQMLDFSRIDLSELYGDITPLPAGQLQNDVQGAFDSFQNNLR